MRPGRPFHPAIPGTFPIPVLLSAFTLRSPLRSAACHPDIFAQREGSLHFQAAKTAPAP